MSSEIPRINFGPFITGTRDTRLAVAKEICSAFRTYGFVCLVNHPIPQSTLTQAFRRSKLFFSLPQSSKDLAPHPPGSEVHRGYSYPGLEKVSDLTTYTDSAATKSLLRQVPDIKESYEIGSEYFHEQPNVWPPPDLLPSFRGFMTSFYWMLAEFSKQIFKALALGLGEEDENYFMQFYTGHHNQLRLLHYPEVEAKVLEEGKAVRIQAHCDWSAFTLLFQDDCGGLEIESPTQPGVFMEVEPVENACLVNIGDLLARWSNDYLRSTSHRVGLPPLQDRYISTPEKRITKARYSIPYFITISPDSVIECLPQFVDEEHPAKYPSVTAREYNHAKGSMQYA